MRRAEAASPQLELFSPATEIVAGVPIPAPRVTRVGPDIVVHPPAALSPVPAQVIRTGPVLPTPSRPFPRAPYQSSLFRSPRTVKLDPALPPVGVVPPRFPGNIPLFAVQPGKRLPERYLQLATRSLLPPDLATSAEAVISRVVNQYQRRFPRDIGLAIPAKSRRLTVDKAKRGGERVLGREDLEQEALRWIAQHPGRLPVVPHELERRLYSPIREAQKAQVYGMTSPSRLGRVDRKVLATAKRLEADPRRAVLASDLPTAVFEALAKDPAFKNLLKHRGGVKEFSPEGVARTLEAGMPKTARTFKVPDRPGYRSTALEDEAVEFVPEQLRAGATALDDLLRAEAEKAAEKAAGSATDPLAAARNRMDLAIKAMTPKQREYFMLKYGFGGKPVTPVRDIAREAGRDPKTVRESIASAEKKVWAAIRSVRRAERAKPTPEPPYVPAGVAPPKAAGKSAAELVTERLAEMRRLVEGRRRWEVQAPIRRMREKEPVRTWKARQVPGETAPPAEKRSGTRGFTPEELAFWQRRELLGPWFQRYPIPLPKTRKR